MKTLREFRVKQFVQLKEIEKELLSKCPEKADRVKYIVEVLKAKLDNLRRFTLYDYLRTLDLASQEFSEFKRMFPAQEEITELLEGGEE